MAHAPYGFTSCQHWTGDYGIVVDRDGALTGTWGDWSTLLLALAALGEEAAMKGRNVRVHGVTAEAIRTAGRSPHPCIEFAAG